LRETIHLIFHFLHLSVFVYPVGPEDRTGAPLREYSFDLSFFLHLSVFAPLREDLFDLSFFYLSAFAPLRETIYLIFYFFILAPLRLCVRPFI